MRQFIERLGRCYMAEEAVLEAPAPAPDAPAQESAGEAAGSAEYYGSIEMNPDQRPLDIITDGMTKAEIDAIIADGGKNVLVNDEKWDAIKKTPKAPKTPDKAKEGEGGTDAGKTPESKDGEEKPDDAKEVEEFLKDADISHEEFVALPEKIQAKMVEFYEKGGESSGKITEVQTKFETLKKDTDLLSKDPVIAARMEELSSGRNLVAKELKPVSDSAIDDDTLDKIDTLMAANNKGEARKLLAGIINKTLKEKASEAVKAERSVIERQIAEAKSNEGTWKVFHEIQKWDPRFKLSETDPTKVGAGHPEQRLFDKGGIFNEFIGWLKDHEYTKSKIADMGPARARELYAGFAAFKGWDKEQLAQAHEKGKKDLLAKLKNPTIAGKTLGQRKSSVDPGQAGGPAGFDRSALLDELVKGNGNSATYDRLLERSGEDEKSLAVLVSVYNEAQRRISAKKG